MLPRSSGIDPRAKRRRQTRAREEADAQQRRAQERRITVRALFDRRAAIELRPRKLAGGTRLGRKDAGAFTKAQFERWVFPKVGDIAVEEVKRANLLTILDGVEAEGKLRMANGAGSTVCTMCIHLLQCRHERYRLDRHQSAHAGLAA
ncbi:MAG: hypothetical protein HS128_11745 [Ideonella sp.]|nr:hypothetical protein [Ideonella sp.]MCC7458018.1 hypothetical protein [Nitrospira sp.]